MSCRRWSALLVLVVTLLSSSILLLLLLQTNLTQAQQMPQQQQQQQQQLSGNTVIVSTMSSAAAASSSSRKPAYISMHACEDRQLTINCDYGSKINLIRANYGRFSISVCNDEGQSDLSTDCTSPISYRIMHERCQNQSRCSINATSAIFGDRCPKTRKYLEVHYQCQPDSTFLTSGAKHQIIRPNEQQQQQANVVAAANSEPSVERVDLRNASSILAASSSSLFAPQVPNANVAVSPVLPANNNQLTSTINTHHQHHHHHHQQQQQYATARPVEPQPPPFIEELAQQQSSAAYSPQPMMNSKILNYSTAIDTSKSSSIYNNLAPQDSHIVVALRHLVTENMSNPRCVLWDQLAHQWTERGSQIIETNSTHTICAFDQATQYLLVMDYLGPRQTFSPVNPLFSQQPVQLPTQPPVPFGNPIPGIMDRAPVVLDPQSQVNNNYNTPRNNSQQQQQQQPSPFAKFFSLFGYFLAIVFVAIGSITIAFIASSMRSSAGAAFKSLGHFTAFGGPKYKNRRADGTLHNKDLLVINNQNGHQFIYAPASTTKISTSASTHILTGANSQHQNTLHQIQQQQQQQQMYSGNGTLSNLSGTGGQSNNYYYGLMGFNSHIQQQQQQHHQLQHHLSQHHLNQHQQVPQQQTLQASNYPHQANKSTMSTESSNSTPSSSGVESASTSMQQQQQQQQQQSCLMMNSEYNLMGHLSNYGHHQNLMSQQQQQPTLTLNAHYSSSGQAPMGNMSQNQQHRLFNNVSQAMREHIYECVDDDKAYGARGMLLPTASMDANDQHLFGSNTMALQSNQQQTNLSRAMTLSSRLIQDAMQQNHQQLATNQTTNTTTGQANSKRLFSHPAIVRDNQNKTNIICSQLAQVTPQRATEINKFQHDVMAIYNGSETTTTTATNATTVPSSQGNYGRSDFGDLGGLGGNKLSTDC